MTVRAHGFSASARQKIEAAGGTATVIEELEVGRGCRGAREEGAGEGEAAAAPRRPPRRGRR